jgi:hypothetical protein
MPVHIAATLDHATVRQLLSELLPLTVDLGDDSHRDRWIVIEPPQLLEFVPKAGIRVQTGAQLHWTVAGVGVPFTVSSVRLLLTPVVDEAAARVNLHIKLEDTDLKNVPKAIDRGVVSQLNARLSARPDALGWDYGKTLGLHKELPAKMAPLAAFEMSAGTMQVEIDDASLRLSLPLPMRFLRRPA